MTRDETRPTHDAPYRGIRVLDFGQGIASPYCGALLAAHGADVIKVEPPEGDWSRRLGTTYGLHTAISSVFNRGKRSLCLDLKSTDGRAVAQRLASDSDIVIEGFRPGVAARLGLGYADLSRANPRLIYLSVSGFGQAGPSSNRPCSDSVAQAFGGLVSVNRGDDGIPHRVGTPIIDVATGAYAFQAIGAALFARANVGSGRWIDISLTQTAAALLGHKFAEFMLEGGAPRALNVPAGTYRSSDGWLMVTLVNEAQYRRLCAVLGRNDLATDPRFSDFAKRSDAADVLIAEVRATLLTKTTGEWLSALHAADLIAERILDPGEWLADPHVTATHGAVMIETPGVGPVYAARMPGAAGLAEDVQSPSPDLGQHSREVLRDNGYTEADIDMLLKAGTVIDRSTPNSE